MWIDLVADGRAATRALAKRPGAAVTVIVMLALGTAINAAVFAVVHAALFGGIAQVDRSDRIVRIGTTRGFVYYPDVQVWRARATSFEDVGLVRGVFHTVDAGSNTPQTCFTMETTANTFRLLHVRPLFGRDFSAADEQPGLSRLSCCGTTSGSAASGRVRTPSAELSESTADRPASSA